MKKLKEDAWGCQRKMSERLCKKCGNKFEHDEEKSGVPNPKCPKCKTRATKQTTKSGKQKTTEKKEGPTMWQTLQARKAGLFNNTEEAKPKEAKKNGN